MMYHFCTYFDRNYLARGLALYHSLDRHTASFALYVLCLDDFTYTHLTEQNLPGLIPISLESFEAHTPALLEAKQHRSLIEYYFTCTPILPRYVLERFSDVDIITYLDADLYFYADPAPIYEELGAQSIMIVGHRYPEGMRHLEIYGIYNVSYMAFRNDTYGLACLQWWGERCLEWCYDRFEDGKYGDQKYLDDWPERFEKVVVLQQKGAGLAPWNVAQYDIRRSKGTMLVDTDPLIFYHFHYLAKAHTFVYRTGLEFYGGYLHTMLRQEIYYPYLRELESIRRELPLIPTRSAPARETTRSFRDRLRSMIYGNYIFVAGPITKSIYLEPVIRPLLQLRKVLKGNPA